MADDLLARSSPPCPECGGRDRHFIDCVLLAENLEAKKGVCPVCWLVRPCEHG